MVSVQRALEGRAVARADGASGELLGGRRQPVEKIGADHGEVDQDFVGGEHHVAAGRALRREEGEGEEEREGADHDVAVDRDHAAERSRDRRRGAKVSVDVRGRSAADDQRAGDGRDDLGDDARPADAGDAVAEAEHEGDAERDVEAVQQRLQREAVAGAPEADQPAEDDVVGEREGRGEDADADSTSRVAAWTSSLPPMKRCDERQDRRLQDEDRRCRRRRRGPARGRERRRPRVRLDAPCACATKPVVPARRKLKVVKTMSKISAPMEMPPTSAGVAHLADRRRY